MAGFDQAIHDGVDVLSISLAGKYQNYSTNPIALGAFRAMQKGMFVSCAAGNFGPLNNSVQNLAPWILTVGASTVDRELRSDTKLGSGKVLVGQSFFLPKGTKPMLLPLVYLVKDRECNGNLSMFGVSGKLMLCDNVARGSGFPIGSIVKKAGGAGLIFVNPIEDGFVLRPEGNVLPISNVNISEGNEIKAYINSTQDPKATIIVKGIVIGEAVAPIVANFSAEDPISIAWVF
ncbi:hypothetical protein AMTR_s00044p00139130 [Amborella trichopoda]|uniref:Peptidase S8/S53 domain-containing protein n=1 Tax=Amborella trichopoda TaxID=13333 RepID=U5D9V5_AMBTC|nr:hypothetical protein AMTR_s00044p00139130 [Amborella trichopoda]